MMTKTFHWCLQDQGGVHPRRPHSEGDGTDHGEMYAHPGRPSPHPLVSGLPPLVQSDPRLRVSGWGGQDLGLTGSYHGNNNTQGQCGHELVGRIVPLPSVRSPHFLWWLQGVMNALLDFGATIWRWDDISSHWLLQSEYCSEITHQYDISNVSFWVYSKNWKHELWRLEVKKLKIL